MSTAKGLGKSSQILQRAAFDALEKRRLMAVDLTNYALQTQLAVGDVLYASYQHTGYVPAGANALLVRSNLDGSNATTLHEFDYNAPTNLYGYNGKLYFGDNPHSLPGNEPWVSDGTAGGTHLIADIYHVGAGSDPHDFHGINGSVYFLARSNSPYADSLFVTKDGDGVTMLSLDGSKCYNGPSNIQWLSDHVEFDQDIDRISYGVSQHFTTAGSVHALYTQPIKGIATFYAQGNVSIQPSAGGMIDAVMSNLTLSYRAADLSGISLTAGGDTSAATIDPAITLPITYKANANVATLRGGSGAITLDFSSQSDFGAVGVTLSGSGGHVQFKDGQTLQIVGNVTEVTGTVFNDTLIGTSKNETLKGDAGSDAISGNGGDDYLDGGYDIIINNVTGDDTLLGGAGNDTLIGDDGNDLLDGGAGNNSLLGGKGDDTLYSQSAGDTLDGGTGDNVTLTGSANVSDAWASIDDSNDLSDTLPSLGGDGTQTVSGNGGTDTTTGNDGDSGSGTTTTVDRTPHPYYTLSDGVLRVYGIDDDSNYIRLIGSGDSIKIGLDGVFSKVSAAGIRSIIVRGGAKNDGISLNNLEIPSKLYGLGGDDTIVGSAGKDRIYGGDGDDILHGGDNHDTIYGESGNDQLFGEGGHDYIVAGSGTDALRGGASVDHLIFATGDDVRDNAGDKLTIDDLLG